MSEWRDKLVELRTAIVANDWTPTQIRSATDQQIKTLLSLSDEVFDRVKERFDKMRHLAAAQKEAYDNEAMFAQIISKLTAAENQWLKAQDSIWLAERINPPVREVLQ